MNLSFKLGKYNLSLGATRSASSPIQGWLRGEDSLANKDSSILLSPFQQSVWVYTVVSALAQTVSTIPFRIARGDRSGENILSTGPVIDLFNRPHPYLNRFRFWEFIVTWYCLRGEVFVVALDQSGHIVPVGRANKQSSSSGSGSLSSSVEERAGVRSRSGSSSIKSLLVLNPDNFGHIVEGFELIGWRFSAAPLSGPLGAKDLLPEEVIHDAMPNPYLFWRGMSPLSVAMLAAQTDYASAQFMKGLMLNNADTGVIVRTDQQLSGEQREQLASALRARKAGAGTADRPLLLWAGAEVVQPTLSTADLQFMDNRKMNRQEICAAFFRIPQTLVGFTENANRAIAESERLNFIENSITPLCARLEVALEPVVKSFGQDLVGWFDIESTAIMQQARRSRVDTGVKLFALGYPANAINKTLDLGLPHLPWGEKGYLPANLQTAGEIPPPTPPTKAASPIDRMLETLEKAEANSPSPSQIGRGVRGEGTINDQHPNHQPTPGRDAVPRVNSESPSPNHTGRGVRGEGTINNQLPDHQPATHPCCTNPAHEQMLKTRIKKKQSRISAFFFDQRNRVLANVNESPSPSQIGRGDRGEGPMFSVEAETKLLAKKLGPLLRSDLEFGFKQAAAELGAMDLTLPTESLLAFEDQCECHLRRVNETTLAELNYPLQQGAELADRIKAIFQEASDCQAATLAEAQTHSAINRGRFFAMMAAGVEKKTWQTANDAKVRPAHAQAQVDYAKGIPIDEPFIVGGEPLMYPGDPSGSPGNVINCRCWTSPITDDQ